MLGFVLGEPINLNTQICREAELEGLTLELVPDEHDYVSSAYYFEFGCQLILVMRYYLVLF